MTPSQKILIVDDEPKLVRLAQELLVATDFTVVAASDGKTAVGMAQPWSSPISSSWTLCFPAK